MSDPQNSVNKLADHLFRHEAGKMVAVLTRIFGLHNLELAEDVVQEAFGAALKAWIAKIPSNPSAWLMQTAKNKAIDIVRKNRHQQQFAEETSTLLKSEYTAVPVIENLFMDTEIQDSQLRMIFACCHPSLAESDQIALTLKTCSGFSSAEIAAALLSNNEAIKKRIQRAKSFVIEQEIKFIIPTGEALSARLNTVLHTVYLIFNEGYNSSTREDLIRKDLCEEALRLSLLLTEHAFTNQPKCYALVALLSLLSSRFEARLDEGGEMILLQEQDRTKWNRDLISIGLQYLETAMAGDELSEYHLEAAIVAEHSIAPSFSDTNWQRILSLYNMLIKVSPSPLALLNRAIVVGRLNGPQKAINEIRSIPEIEELTRSQHLFPATLGEMYLQLNKKEKARACFEMALQLTHSPVERKLLQKKVGLL